MMITDTLRDGDSSNRSGSLHSEEETSMARYKIPAPLHAFHPGCTSALVLTSTIDGGCL